MKKSSFSYFPIVVAGVCLAVFVMTADAIKIDHPKYREADSDIVPGRYIVSFTGDSSSAATSAITKAPAKAAPAPANSSPTNSLSDSGTDIEVEEEFNHSLFNGASIKVDTENPEDEAKTIKSILDRDDVLSITPIRLHKRPEVIQGEYDPKVAKPSVLPHAMTQVDRVHEELKNKGKGVLVAVLDSGIDYTHPAFGSGFGPGFKVSKGYDLVGDKYSGSNTPIPDSDPLDACGAASGATGHGTHVAGIIAGFDPATNFTGVAPEANLAIYRVFGCKGSVGTDIVIKGLLMAYDAGADVISISLGTKNNWNAGNPEHDVINKISAAGVSVVISTGNFGQYGYYTVGQPATAAGAFAVASIENQFQTTYSASFTGVTEDVEYLTTGSPLMKNGKVVASDATFTSTTDACTAASISSAVNGTIALTQRGGCTFEVKMANLATAGATGIIFYNNVDTAVAPVSAPKSLIPVISIAKAAGLDIIASLKKGEVTAEFGKEGISESDLGGSVDYFSSVGSEAALNFKPNIAAVGGTVLSTLPSYLGNWGVLSGTSMAAPYVAGSVALYVKSQGTTKQPASFIYEQFQNYAYPVKVAHSNITDSPMRQGAGLVQVYDAITQTTHVSPAQISFNDTATTNYRTKTLTITNRGAQTIAYELVNEVATGIAPYDVATSGYTPLEPAVDTTAEAGIKFSIKTFKLYPGNSQKVTVTVIPPKTNPADHIFYGGNIRVISKQQNLSLDTKIPYFGKVGITKTLPIFDTDGFPVIIDPQSNLYGPNDTFTYDRANKATRPISTVRLLTPTKRIKADLIDATTQKVLGEFFTGYQYMGRDLLVENNQYTTVFWDGNYVPASLAGVTDAIPAPAGTYLWRLSALKLLGDEANKNDWETWTSGPIVLKN